MIRKIIQLLALCLIIAGCNSIPELSAYRKIEVPDKYQYGKGHLVGTSAYERYLYAYEQSFWRCINDRANNINYLYEPEDLIGNGWPSAIDGTHDGYLAANNHIDSLVKYYGEEKVQEYLREETGFEFRNKKQ